MADNYFRGLMKTKDFVVFIERDEDGKFIAEVPDLKGCYTQGDSVEEALKNIREVIEMCSEETAASQNEFIGVQKIQVPV